MKNLITLLLALSPMLMQAQEEPIDVGIVIEQSDGSIVKEHNPNYKYSVHRRIKEDSINSAIKKANKIIPQERVSTYEDGFSFALGFDLANATIGGTVNPPKLDYTIDAFYRSNNIELGVAIECFPYLHYRSEGLYIRYVEDLGIKNKWEVAPSIGRGTIIRDFGQFRSWNTQVEVRYKIRRFKIVYCVEYRHRTDLDRFVLSSFGKGSLILFKD